MSIATVDNFKSTNAKPFSDWDLYPNTDGTYRQWASSAEVITFFADPSRSPTWAKYKFFWIAGVYNFYTGNEFIPIGAPGNIKGLANTATVPAAGATPGSQYIYFSGPGTYTNFPDGGSPAAPIVLTEALNIISWDGTKATVLGVVIPLTGVVKYDDLQKEQSNQLFDKDNIRQDTAIGSAGQVVAATGAETTLDINIPDGQTKLSWSGYASVNSSKGISFYDSTGLFISKFSPTTLNGTTDIPATAKKFNFYYKTPADPATAKDTLMLNFGAAPLEYEPFGYTVTGIGDMLIKNANKNFIESGQTYLKGETYSKAEVNAMQPVFGTSVVPGVNEFDIATMTKANVNVSSTADYGITNITSWTIAVIKLRAGQKRVAISGWNSVRTELGVGTQPVPPTFSTPFAAGLIKSGNATHMGFTKTSGAAFLDITNLVDGVTGDVYLYLTIKNNTEASSVYSNLMVADAAEPVDYEPYADVSVVNSINEMDIAAKNIIGSDGTVIQTDNIATKDQISLKFKEIKFDGDIVKVRTDHNSVYDLVQSVSLTGSNNGTANILAAYLVKKNESIDATTIQVTVNGDATAPIQFPNTNSVGINNAASNHGLSAIKLVTDAHGKDSTDILSIWTDGTWEYVLVDIIDATHLLLMSKPQNVGGEMLCKIVNTLSTTLTNVSGGTHAADITGAVGSDAGQFPMVKNAISGLKIDGIEIVNPGTYQGNMIEIHDYSEPIDPATIIFQNPMVWNDGDTLAKMTTTYKFFPNGILQMDCLIDPVIDHTVRNFGFIQLLKMTVTATYNKLVAYMNGINSFVLSGNTYDFKAGVNITGTIDSMTIVSSQLEDANVPPSRQTQILFDTTNMPFLGTAHGYNTLVGQGKDSVRKLNTQYWFINGGIQKSYPYGYAGLMTTGIPIYGTAYFAVFDPNKNNLRADYYYHQSETEKVYILETSQAETKRNIILPAELTGKRIEILSQSAGLTLLTPDYIQAQGIIISATGAGEYLKLKLS